MVQKQKGVYVRIPQRDEDFKNPRDFLCGQVIETDETLSQTTVRINDPYSYDASDKIPNFADGRFGVHQ